MHAPTIRQQLTHPGPPAPVSTFDFNLPSRSNRAHTPPSNPWLLHPLTCSSILHEHGVRHPSTAKKADLVALFINEIQPRAAAILAQDARVKPSSTGIVAVSSTGQETAVEPVVGKRPRGRPRKTATSASEELKPEGEASDAPIAKRPRSRRSTVDITSADEEPPTPAPKRRGRPPKKLKEVEDDARMEDIQETLAVPTPKAPRRQSSSTQAEPEQPHVRQKPVVEITRHAPVPSSSHKPRTSFMPPVKSEEHTTPRRQSQAAEVASAGSSPFSDYNPFQAGSAEAAEVVRRRRKVSSLLRIHS